MQIINVRKWLLRLVFLSYALVPNPSNAVGLAIGPTLGIAGFRTSFDAKPSHQTTSINNFAVQLGCFAKLDIWLLYAKLDGLFVLDWHKLPNKLDRNHFKHITLPLTIGMSCLGILRPHLGFIFRIPLAGLDDACFTGNHLIESYKKKFNGYIVGLGVDLGKILIDIYLEFRHLSVARKHISAALVDGEKHHRPKQITVRVGYNLLG